MIVKNDLFDYESRYIYQDNELFKFSLDSILLAEYASIFLSNNMQVLDLCTGNMAVPLIMSKYSSAHVTGFEIQKKVYELGCKSILENQLSNQLTIINDDVKNIKQHFASEYFDVMVCNPPFFKEGSSIKNVNTGLSMARHEISINLEDIFQIARSFLKNNGSLVIVHRVNRLDEIINLGFKYKIHIKNIQLISTKEDKKPSIVLVRAVKNSKSGVIINKEKCIENVKSYQNMFKE